jgi:hypothetical protein
MNKHAAVGSRGGYGSGGGGTVPVLGQSVYVGNLSYETAFFGGGNGGGWWYKVERW